MVENWRPVALPDWKDLYEVSDQGRVRRTATKRVLKPGAHPRGYHSIVFSNAPLRTCKLVHRLVLEAFVGPCPKGLETLHGNGVRTDNRLSNLRWGTSSENEDDKRRHGTSSQGTGNAMVKLTEEQVQEVRTRYANGGESQKTLAAAYGVAQGTISRLVTGARWGHLAGS